MPRHPAPSSPSDPSTGPAITLALRALAHMAGSDGLSSRFLADSGMSPDHMAASAADPEFLAAVLDFFLSDDGSLVDLSEDLGIAPAEVAAARRHLPGGLLPHWT